MVVTKRRAKTSDPSSILRPFHSYVWLAIAMSVCVVSGTLSGFLSGCLDGFLFRTFKI